MENNNKHWSEKELKTHDGEVILPSSNRRGLRHWVDGETRVLKQMLTILPQQKAN